jgi:archaellum component FlaC
MKLSIQVVAIIAVAIASIHCSDETSDSSQADNIEDIVMNIFQGRSGDIDPASICPAIDAEIESNELMQTEMEQTIEDTAVEIEKLQKTIDLMSRFNDSFQSSESQPSQLVIAYSLISQCQNLLRIKKASFATLREQIDHLVEVHELFVKFKEVYCQPSSELNGACEEISSSISSNSCEEEPPSSSEEPSSSSEEPSSSSSISSSSLWRYQKAEPNVDICDQTVSLYDDCEYVKHACLVSAHLSFNEARVRCIVNGMNLLRLTCDIFDSLDRFIGNSTLASDYWVNGVRTGNGRWHSQPRHRPISAQLVIKDSAHPGDCLAIQKEGERFAAVSVECSLKLSFFCEYKDCEEEVRENFV